MWIKNAVSILPFFATVLKIIKKFCVNVQRYKVTVLSLVRLGLRGSKSLSGIKQSDDIQLDFTCQYK